MLEEVGADYRLVRVIREAGKVEPPEFETLTPHRRVPVLVDGDLVLYESAAIVMHLCDSPPGGRTRAGGRDARAGALVPLADVPHEHGPGGVHGLLLPGALRRIRRAPATSATPRAAGRSPACATSSKASSPRRPVPPRRALHERRPLPLHAHPLGPAGRAEVVGRAGARRALTGCSASAPRSSACASSRASTRGRRLSRVSAG